MEGESLIWEGLGKGWEVRQEAKEWVRGMLLLIRLCCGRLWLGLGAWVCADQVVPPEWEEG